MIISSLPSKLILTLLAIGTYLYIIDGSKTAYLCIKKKAKKQTDPNVET